MKAVDRYILILAVGALPVLPAGAATADAGNPYAMIVARNAFALKDPPSPESIVPQKDPPPKITLQGIAKVLNRKQVLFKVAMPAKPPQPAGEVSKILAEGEREGEIEVLEIDEIAGAIKFNNHGTPETKTLKDDSAKPAPGSMAMAAPGVVPQPAPFGGGTAAAPAPVLGSGGTTVTTIGSSARAAGLQNIPTRPSRTIGGGGVPSSAVQQPDVSPEEQIVLMEVDRELNKNNPKYPPLPPTPITPNPTANTPPPIKPQ